MARLNGEDSVNGRNGIVSIAGSSWSRRRFLGVSAAAGVGVIGSQALAGCAPSAPAPAGSGNTTISWTNAANAGEAVRFEQLAADYEARTGVKIDYQRQVGDFQAKLTAQLLAGTAADVFPVGDALMAALIENGQITDLSGWLDGPDAGVDKDLFHPRLLEWCRDPRPGKDGLYGLPVDCNPRMFWFNDNVLKEAGVDGNPALMFADGGWDRDATTLMLEKVKGTGKTPYVLEAKWAEFFSWLSTFGGTPFDADGNPVFADDAACLDALAWLFDMLDRGYMTFGGALPQGQAADALFFSGQSAALGAGRWILPNLRDLGGSVAYDVAPFPSMSGGEVMPVAVVAAALAVNAASKQSEAALDFLGWYVGTEGVTFRLSGGGNAVPAITGLDHIVTDGDDPAHSQFFLDAVAKGFTVPRVIVGQSGMSAKLETRLNELFTAGGETPASFSQKLTDVLNGG